MFKKKSYLSRRKFLSLAGASGATLALAACMPIQPPAATEDDESEMAAPADDGSSTEGDAMGSAESMTLESGSVVNIYSMEGGTIHTYTEGFAGNSTYIIEGENSLVLVDAQMVAPLAQEFRAYADSLEKPIERMIISHEHPDHWFGLGAAFEDVPIFSTASTQTFINNNGAGMLEARAEAMGTANVFVEIGNVLPEGGETIDGITYEYSVYQDAEAHEQVVIMMPELGAMASGDLIYNEWHMVLTTSFDNWIADIEELQTLEGYSLVLPGHGPPTTDMEVFNSSLDYLQTARDLHGTAEGPEDFKAQLLEAYPDRAGAFFIDMVLGRLYP